MGPTSKLVHAGAVLVFAIALQTQARADEVGHAARLSAALGGDLGDGMSNAGAIGHGCINSMAEPRVGRSEAYRRRVAFDTQLATDEGRGLTVSPLLSSTQSASAAAVR
jgi:hypothetical protein